VVESMKDFYWDIRPKPEYGTVEIRVFDTPLTVERAARIAAYAQSIASYLLSERSAAPSSEVYLLYNYNRFQACRYGLEATVVDAYEGKPVGLRGQVRETLRTIRGHAQALGNIEAMDALASDVDAGYSDADWLRSTYKKLGSMSDVAREQSALWMGS